MKIKGKKNGKENRMKEKFKKKLSNKTMETASKLTVILKSVNKGPAWLPSGLKSSP